MFVFISADISLNSNAKQKTFTKSDNHLNKSEEKENIETIDPKVIPENEAIKPEIIAKEIPKPVVIVEEELKDDENSIPADKEVKTLNKTSNTQNKSSVIKTSASNPSLNTITTTASKPLK